MNLETVFLTQVIFMKGGISGNIWMNRSVHIIYNIMCMTVFQMKLWLNANEIRCMHVVKFAWNCVFLITQFFIWIKRYILLFVFDRMHVFYRNSFNIKIINVFIFENLYSLCSSMENYLRMTKFSESKYV